MHKGDGQNLSGWIKRRISALFVVLVVGGIDHPVSLAVPAGSFAAGVIRNQERRKKKVSNKKKQG